MKDHKPPVSGSNIPPLREVVSGSGSNTEFISAYVDHHAKPEVQRLPSYIKDTPDILRKIALKNKRGPLPPGSIPVTMDVSALYPSVPQEEGLTSLERALDRRADKSIPTAYLVLLMRLVLAMNTFVWDSKLFKQIMGTAIGTRSAPTFCGLFMGDLEEKMLQEWENMEADYNPDEWWRFIDDILFWWSGTPGELLIFINFVTSVHPDIKFTCDYNFQTRSVVFLDLVISVDEQGYIQTDQGEQQEHLPSAKL